jgi:hypothetical protein
MSIIDFSVLKSEVAAYKEVGSSVIALIKGIAHQLYATAGDSEKVKEFAAVLHHDADHFADSVVAQTPLAKTSLPPHRAPFPGHVDHPQFKELSKK